MAYLVKHVANCFLQRDFEDGCATITPMKLQKLVYCLHGWHLAITDEPAIDGVFEAWPYGPVEEDLYHIFKPYGGSFIRSYANTWEGGEQKSYVVNPEKRDFYDIFDFVVKKYMAYDALYLSTITHMPGTPWSRTKEAGGGIIENDLIKQHFRSLVK